MIDDLAQGDAAEQRAEEALLPAAAVGAVEQSHAEVTGEVRPLSKHRVLHATRVGNIHSVSVIQKVGGTSCWNGTDLVEVAVQPVVNDGVEILQAAPVERVEDVSARPGLLEPGVHLVRVFQLKQEIWHGSRGFLVLRQFKKICQLESKTQVSQGHAGVRACASGSIPHLSVASSQQNSLRRESSAPAPGDVLRPWLGAAPTLERRVETSHLPTGGDTISDPPIHTHALPQEYVSSIHLTFYDQKLSLPSRSIGNLLPPSVCMGEQPRVGRFQRSLHLTSSSKSLMSALRYRGGKGLSRESLL